jgi:hypothetical protein
MKMRRVAEWLCSPRSVLDMAHTQESFTNFVAHVVIHKLGWRIFGGYVRDYVCHDAAPKDLDVYYEGVGDFVAASKALCSRFTREVEYEVVDRITVKLSFKELSVEVDLVNPNAPDIVGFVDFDVNNLVVSRRGIEQRVDIGRSTSLIVGNIRARRCAVRDFRPERTRYMLSKRVEKQIRAKKVYVVNLPNWLQDEDIRSMIQKEDLDALAKDLFVANEHLKDDWHAKRGSK